MTSRAAPADDAAAAGTGAALLALVHAEAAHPHALALAGPPEGDTARGLADAVHALCVLHGRMPGIVDHAALRETDRGVARALHELADAFAMERALLARLAVAAGPLPSTPGQPDAEAALTAQRHALDTLGRSDRRGCAGGAALAVALEWRATRPVLDAAAVRWGVAAQTTRLPDAAAAAAIADRLAGDGDAAARALLFGARQASAQARQLWDLLARRAQARRDAS